MQLEIRLFGEMSDNHFKVAHALVIDLEEFTRVRVSQLPRLDATVASAVRRLVIENEEVTVEEWIHWLR